MKPLALKFWLSNASALCCLLAATPTTAQIVPDATLPVNSTVTPQGNTPLVPPATGGTVGETFIRVIEGGTRAGGNLFHSFQEFSIPTGSEAFFNNALDVQNIFSRVTGRSISNIDGLIRANGIANLFLLNPNGIIFGPNARLNIGGSFLATTANSFKFADGIEFSATNPQATPLLSINVPIGLQMGSNPGNITVQGQGLSLPVPPEGETTEQQAARLIAFEQEFLDSPVGLQVQPGRTLALVGGNLTFNGGLVKVRQGRIELGSVSSGTVSLNATEKGFALGYDGVPNFGDIQMSQLSVVSAAGEGGGSIQVRGGQINLIDSRIGANTIGSQNGGGVSIQAERLSLNGASLLVSNTFSAGDAGNLTVTASESVELNGISADGQFRSSIQTISVGTGKAGNITIDTGRLIIRDGAFVSSQTLSKGQGGNLTVRAEEKVEVSGTTANGKSSSLLSSASGGSGDAGNLTIQTGQLIIQDGAEVSSFTNGTGKAGSLLVNANDLVEVSGTSADGEFASALTTLTSNAGNAGDMTIQTGRLIIRDGAFVSTDTRGTGNGGNLLVQAGDSVEVVGAQPNGLPSRLSAQVEGRDGPRGNGGNLTIETGTLSIRDGGRVSTETWGQGNAGNLQVWARDLVEVVGEGPVTPELPRGISSSLTSAVGPSGVGNGGNLTIETPRLSVRDGARVSVDLYGQGKGGNIEIRASEGVEVVGAGRLQEFEGSKIRNSSSINADVLGNGVGSGGNINIETQVLTLRDGGGVSAGTSGVGNAGNIRVQASKSVEIVGAASDGNVSGINTSVLADAVGSGGNINIETQVLTLRDGGGVSAFTSGVGNSGNIHIRATDAVELVGATPDNRVSSTLSINVLPGAKGNGGNITVETRRLTLRDAFISAGTFGDGNAGDILLRASEAVESSGNSLIGAVTFEEATGNGGKITIETRRLQLVDDSDVLAFTSSQGKGGTITLRASESVQLSDSSNLSAFTNSVGDAGNLVIETGQLIIQDPGIKIFANSFGEGNGGNIEIQANRFIVRNGAQVSATAFDAGNAGRLTVRADLVEVTGESADGQLSSLSADTLGTGAGGNLTIETGQLIVRDGAQIGALASSTGNAGSLKVSADLVEVTGKSAVGQLSSLLIVATLGTGAGGDLTIETERLIVRGGARVEAGTFDAGKGGSLTVKADLVEVTGSSADGQPLSALSSSTLGTGDAGSLTIQAGRLIVRDGAQIAAAASSTGNAGSLKVSADLVELAGTTADGQFSSGLFASSKGTGAAGNLTINAGRLIVRDGARVTVSGIDSGAAGKLDVTAGSILLDNGTLKATTAAGTQGNINVRSPSIIMRRGSEITTNATGKATGGNIAIDTEVLAALENSDISANAEDSFGGRVTINAQAIFGTEFRPDNTPQSDITATSKLGPSFSGTVQINTPDVDPSSGLVELPKNVVDASQLVAKGCIARRRETGTFYITGAGGLQTRPLDAFVSPFPTGEVRSVTSTEAIRQQQQNEPIVEAQGIYQLENGQVVLGWLCSDN